MSEVSRAYGLYTNEELIVSNESVTNQFVLPLEFMENWKRCSDISNIIANIRDADGTIDSRAKNSLSVVINELIENAVKYSSDPTKIISITLEKEKNIIEVETINMSNYEHVEELEAFMVQLESSNIEALYFEQLIKASESQSADSGLGFMTILHDFELDLGIKIVKKSQSLDRYDVFVKVKAQREKLLGS